jgi:hypothetical protein
MQISHAALILTLAVAGGAVYGQDAGAPAGGTVQAPTATEATPVNTASSLLKPSLAAVQDTLNGLKLDRWKKGSVRDEAGAHVESLLKDLQTTLPSLVTAADGGSLSQAIPLMKHLDAFYDVLLRVEEGSRVSAPGDQVGALQQSLLQLNQARLALDDHLQTDAAAQEKQVGDLQVALKSASAAAETKPVVAAPAPCKPVVPAKKKPVIKKPAATGTPSTTTPGAAAPGTTPGKPAPAKPSATTPTKPAANAPAKPPTGQPQG